MNRINKTAAQKLIIIFIFSPIFEIFSNFGIAGNRLMIFAIEPHVKTWKKRRQQKIFSLESVWFWSFKQQWFFLDDTIWNIIWIFWRTFWIQSFRSEKLKKNTFGSVIYPKILNRALGLGVFCWIGRSTFRIRPRIVI